VLATSTSVLLTTTEMQRTNPNFRNATLSEEEANSFLDDLFSNLLDTDDISSDCDKIPDLGTFDRAA
jgi:hypothetical protein